MSDNFYIQPTKSARDHAILTNISYLKHDSSPLRFHKKEFSSQTHGFSHRSRRDDILKWKQYHSVCYANYAIPQEPTYLKQIWKSPNKSAQSRRRVPIRMTINHSPLGGPHVVTPNDGKSKYVPSNDEVDTEYSGFFETLLHRITTLFRGEGKFGHSLRNRCGRDW